MARPKKKPEYNFEEVSQQVIEAITDAYLNPSEGTADEDGKMYINLLAEEFSMSRIKVRKLLITSGAYETPISRQVGELYKSGKTVKEIQTITGLSAASISGYLPYQKTIYNLEESTKPNGYRINPNLKIMTDYEQFEELCNSIKPFMPVQKKIEILKEAVKLYDGKLFPNGDGEMWHISHSAKYHMMYIKAVDQLMELLNESEDYKALHDYAMRTVNIPQTAP